MSAVSGGSGASSKRGLNSKTKKQHQNQNHHNPPPLSLVASAAELAHSFLSQNDLLLLPSQTLTLESLLSSASSALSSISSTPPPPPPPPQPHSPPPPQECWFSRFLLLSAADVILWRSAFRMSEHSFLILLSVLSPVLNSAVPSVSPDYALAAAIYRLAHGAGYKAVGRRFGMDSAAACRAFYAVCKAVHDKLGEDLFELLRRRRSDTDELPPNCCGALGFGRFAVAGEVLGVNGSLSVQALVDFDGSFLDVSAGWPGTMMPEAIFRQSKLYLRVEESGEDLLKGGGAVHELDDGYLLPQYILGDSCFPMLPWLLTPYVSSKEESNFGAKEKAFNAAHCRVMGMVATAFLRVKARWQLLRREWKEECMEFLPYVVVTGCLLHNFLIKCSEPLPDDNVEECSRKQEEEGLDVFEGQMDESGERIRDALATHLSHVSLR